METQAITDHPLEECRQEDDTDDTNEEQLDPRIQIELERLNTAGERINKLSSELDEGRSKFRSMLNDSTTKLNSMLRQNRKSIERARPFYEAKQHAKKVQTEAQQSAIQYQRATIEYRAAKETIELAEERFLSCTEEEKRDFDSAWQEMLNHATIKVMASENEKTRSERIHLQMSAAFQTAEAKLHQIEKKHRRSVSKSRPFFELKSQLEIKLQQQKQNVEDLQNAVKTSHQTYSEALQNLEHISEDIHTRRKNNMILMTPREPGVGAESDMSLPEINLDSLDFHRTHSSMSSFPSDISEEDRYLDQSTEESDVFSQSEESGIFSLDSFDSDSVGRRDSRNKTRSETDTAIVDESEPHNKTIDHSEYQSIDHSEGQSIDHSEGQSIDHSECQSRANNMLGECSHAGETCADIVVTEECAHDGATVTVEDQTSNDGQTYSVEQTSSVEQTTDIRQRSACSMEQTSNEGQTSNVKQTFSVEQTSSVEQKSVFSVGQTLVSNQQVEEDRSQLHVTSKENIDESESKRDVSSDEHSETTGDSSDCDDGDDEDDDIFQEFQKRENRSNTN